MKSLLIYRNSLSLRHYLRQSLVNLFPNFCCQLNMTWLILAKYSISGTRWGAQSIHKCMNKNSKCLKTRGVQCASKILLTLRQFFFFFWRGGGGGGGPPPPPGRFFLFFFLGGGGGGGWTPSPLLEVFFK